MKQYIDKAAVVAEIERRKKLLSDPILPIKDLMIGEKNALLSLLSFINTLEIKDVDLGMEFDNYTKDILACDIQFEPFTQLYNCAKHFFELGLKVQKGGDE